jgi:flagellin
MGMQINTNIAALNSYRNLSNTQNDMSKSLEKLSSGLRINRAADDAAGLAISEGLRSQINGLNVAARNAQDGISVIQTAEGTLTEVHSILQRVRDLAVQAGNDSNSDEARKAIQNEADGLVKELTRISESTNFNGIQLLDGSAGAGKDGKLSFQIGADGETSSTIAVDLSGANVATVAASLSTTNSGAKFDVLTPSLVGGTQTFAITELDTSTTDIEVELDAAGTYKSVQDVADALNASNSFNNALRATVNGDNELVISALHGGAVDVTDEPGTGIEGGTAGVPGTLSFASADGAKAAIKVIDLQIEKISTARASLGAIQNRFESTINSLNVSAENLSAAESRIRDTDMAQEMVNFTRAQILSQAGTAMLAQANTSNQGVLQLLRG